MIVNKSRDFSLIGKVCNYTCKCLKSICNCISTNNNLSDSAYVESFTVSNIDNPYYGYTYL